LFCRQTKQNKKNKDVVSLHGVGRVSIRVMARPSRFLKTSLSISVGFTLFILLLRIYSTTLVGEVKTTIVPTTNKNTQSTTYSPGIFFFLDK
jgi:hypothetical protein